MADNLPEIADPRGVIAAYVQQAQAPQDSGEAPAPDAQTPTGDVIDITPEEDAGRPRLEVIEGGLKAAEQASAPRLDQLPTPGGIALLLLLIGFILFAIQKTANGRTRLQLMWQALLGNASLGAPGSAGGASSDGMGGGPGWQPPQLPAWVP